MRPSARSFRVVRKEISTMKRRCHNELESVLLWLLFVIVTEEIGYEYWQTVKMETTVFSLSLQFLSIADGATAIINLLIRRAFPYAIILEPPPSPRDPYNNLKKKKVL